MPSNPTYSDTYPYERVFSGYLQMCGAEKLPYQILTYLLDMADGTGYTPSDDNARARVRLLKYLYYDGARPLAMPLPTDAQKLSLLFDGNEPVLNTDTQQAQHPKGYRLFAQQYWAQAELEAATILKCYIGRVLPYSPFRAAIGLSFELCINTALDNVTKTTAYSKLFAMECALIEALHGVNIAGIGVCDFNRMAHPDAGSRIYHDEGTHLYRVVNFSIDWQESGGETVKP